MLNRILIALGLKQRPEPSAWPPDAYMLKLEGWREEARRRQDEHAANGCTQFLDVSTVNGQRAICRQCGADAKPGPRPLYAPLRLPDKTVVTVTLSSPMASFRIDENLSRIFPGGGEETTPIPCGLSIEVEGRIEVCSRCGDARLSCEFCNGWKL